MLHRLIRRVRSGPVAPRVRASFELLEGRQLLAATPFTVRTVTADNRGLVTIAFSAAPKAATISKSTVAVFTAGKDGKFGTTDDVVLKPLVNVSRKTHQAFIQVSVPAYTTYRVRLSGSRITNDAGTLLDGEFHGTLPSGNGKAGGNFSFIARKAGGDPIARFVTNLGTMDVQLFKSQVPTTVNNFLHYANSGLYDNSIFHRKTTLSTDGIGVIQGGGFLDKADAKNLPTAIATIAPIGLQARISNLRGTLAMARTSDPNSATDEWYFNNVDNTALDATSTNAGYAVFGTMTTRKGLATMDAIAALKTQNLDPNNSTTPFNTVPVTATTPKQLVIVARLSILDAILPS